MSHQEEIMELQSRVAFQEDALDQLNDEVARQQVEIQRLTEMVKLLNGQLKQLNSNMIEMPENDVPPPHY